MLMCPLVHTRKYGSTNKKGGIFMKLKYVHFRLHKALEIISKISRGWELEPFKQCWK